MSESKLIKGRWVLTGDGVLEQGAVLVNGDSIVAVGDAEELSAAHSDALVLGAEDVAVLPGFINAHHHSHGVTTIQHGIADLLLESWIFSFLGMRKGDTRLETLLSSARQLRGGVTTVVDVHSARGSAQSYAASVDSGLEAYAQAGMRVAFATGSTTQSFLVHGKGQDERFIAQLPVDLQSKARDLLPGANRIGDDDYLDIVQERVESFRPHPLIDVWYAPPGPQWVSDSLMQSIAERAAALRTNVQTHCNESFYEKLQAERYYAKPTVEHLRDLGVLGPNFSIAHGVWLSESEIETMADTGTAVSHNPSSNLRLRAGIAPLNSLLSAGITTGLGMDGTTINEDEDMLNELRLALRLNRSPRYGEPVPSLGQLFEMATSGGAKLMGKQGTLGRLLPGYKADLLVVDLKRVTWPWVSPEVDPLELILLGAKSGDVRTVLVGGEVVLDDGKPTRFDEEAVAGELAAHLAAQPLPRERAALAAEMLPHLEAWYRSWDVPETTPYTSYNAR